MFLLGSLLFTNRDYYSTLLRIVIVTDWQVIEMDAQKRIRKLMEERGWTDYRLAKETNPPLHGDEYVQQKQCTNASYIGSSLQGIRHNSGAVLCRGG